MVKNVLLYQNIVDFTQNIHIYVIHKHVKKYIKKNNNATMVALHVQIYYERSKM